MALRSRASSASTPRDARALFKYNNMDHSIAPMLGLLGTVVGMVGAFDTISVTEGPVRPDSLAGNISEALITTVLGLIVAIPCTAIYTWLRSRIDHHASEVGDIIEQLVAHVQADAGGGAPAPAPRGPVQGQPKAQPQADPKVRTPS